MRHVRKNIIAIILTIYAIYYPVTLYPVTLNPVTLLSHDIHDTQKDNKNNIDKNAKKIALETIKNKFLLRLITKAYQHARKEKIKKESDLKKLRTELSNLQNTKTKYFKVAGLTIGRNFAKELLSEKNGNLEELLQTSKKIHLTALFSDIRNFTTITEILKGENLVKLLQQYFKEITRIIIKNHGIVDKFIGDAVFAVFYGNNSRKNALKAAHDIVKLAQKEDFKLTNFGVSLKRLKKNILYNQLGNGVGIASGYAWRLPIGSVIENGKLEITHIGNVVNLASRLENFSKNPHLKTPIVIGKSVYKKLPKKLKEQFTSIGKHEIKGKKIKQEIFGIIKKSFFPKIYKKRLSQPINQPSFINLKNLKNLRKSF